MLKLEWMDGDVEVETYHESPINLLHQRNLDGIRLRLRARIICILTLQRGFKHRFIKVLGRLFVLNDGVFSIHLESPAQFN